ncbi:MAG: methionine biosynthesis protein MetW [Elusimicrobia bacterium]|nr:methionine biosynthesis protein MetW [Elusimicrobiota bacterium]
MRLIPRTVISVVKSTFRMIFADPKITLDSMNYDDYYETRKDPENISGGIPKRYSFFEKLVNSGSTVLDIGCGNGNLLEYIEEKKNTSSYGYDIAQTSVKRAQAKGVNAKVADITDKNFKVEGVYDYIILSETIEHIAQPEVLLKKIADSFKKEILISIPNVAYFAYRLRLLLGKFPIQWELHPGEHLRFWSIPDFIRWAGEMGYKVKKYYVCDGFPYLEKVAPNLFGSSILYVLVKK